MAIIAFFFFCEEKFFLFLLSVNTNVITEELNLLMEQHAV